jgi:hypothetical protein
LNPISYPVQISTQNVSKALKIKPEPLETLQGSSIGNDLLHRALIIQEAKAIIDILGYK